MKKKSIINEAQRYMIENEEKDYDVVWGSKNPKPLKFNLLNDIDYFKEKNKKINDLYIKVSNIISNSKKLDDIVNDVEEIFNKINNQTESIKKLHSEFLSDIS
ncbi:MAG: hypothetical protein ACOCZ5_00125 [bacterium]